MPHISDGHELWTLGLLNQIIQRDKKNKDALPGSVVKLVKKTVKILKKRQNKRYHKENDCFSD